MHDEGSQWPLKKHHLTADILVIHSLSSSCGIIWFLQVNQCVLPASSLGIVTGSRLSILTFCHCPAHIKLISAPKLLSRRSQQTKAPRRWGQRCFLCSSGLPWVAFYFSEILWELSFLVIYKLNSFPHTSKYKNQGMFIIRGAILTIRPTKKIQDQSEWFNNAVQPRAARKDCRSSSLAPEQHKRGYTSSRHSADRSELQGQWALPGRSVSREYWGASTDIQCDASTNPPPTKPLSSHSVSALPILQIQVSLRVTHYVHRTLV